MAGKITISIDAFTEQSIKALARKRKMTVSGLIREFVRTASKKEKIDIDEQGLGTLLKPSSSVQELPVLDYKTLLGMIREEKFKAGK
ncbi:hypothetical protein [Agriterribacter sp.]|uniref:hypothetical protein n=1 Tax=Agriterribacter sp. TaxID=2821509 RepID=UPI002CFAA9F2|nr:hypothetical protein [Agriterribacter sp.]HRO46966.1 hypothetical protein [Agriterribacter sp.]HRQ19590.1 hypothetical protein [Agriterribacter sp.]